MYTGATSQHKLVWAATWMEHIGVYHEFRGTQVVIDLFEFLGFEDAENSDSSEFSDHSD